MTNLKNLLFLSLMALLLAACNDDDELIIEPDNTTFTVTIDNVVSPSPYFQSAAFAIPIGGTEAAPIFPGDAFEFTFQAGPNVTPGDGGTRLSFATMFVQSNDLFLAPDASGIELYAEGTPIGNGGSVDITNQILLWDAGTEVNEVTGSENQKPQQAPEARDQGIDENGVVTEIINNTDGINELPDVSEVIKVTITNIKDAEFKLRIENVSNNMTIASPASGEGATSPVVVSPGVFVVHTTDNPLFTVGETASEGLEKIAEDGDIQIETDRLTANTGLIVPLSPGAWAVHDQGINPLYTLGQPDFGEGLEAIAEDGNPAPLVASLATKNGVISGNLFDTPVGASSASAIGPNGSYSFSIEAKSGDYLSLTTMFVQSNDWFYAFPEGGIPLFNGDTPISGDLTNQLGLYDSGTEIDEFPGAGLNQVIRQMAADTGAADSDVNIRSVSNPPSNVPAIDQVIKVTITAQ